MAKKRDVYLLKVDKDYTSQICPNCGTLIGKKQLNERVHHCSECGFTCDRDYASSLVIEQTGLIAVGQMVSQSVEEKGYGVVEQSVAISSRRSRKSNP